MSQGELTAIARQVEDVFSTLHSHRERDYQRAFQHGYEFCKLEVSERVARKQARQARAAVWAIGVACALIIVAVIAYFAVRP